MISAWVKRILRNAGWHIRKAAYCPDGTERRVYELFVEKGHQFETVFDVGANIGQTAIAFSTSFPESKIYSFEPFRAAFLHLKRDTESLSNVQAFQFALGAESASIKVKIDSDGASESNSLRSERQESIGDDYGCEEIIVRRGDDFCREKSISSIDLLKVDVEGFEIEVFSGFKEMLETGKISLILSEVNFWKDGIHTEFRHIDAFLKDFGYRCAGLYDIAYLPNGGFMSANALFIRQKNGVK